MSHLVDVFILIYLYANTNQHILVFNNIKVSLVTLPLASPLKSEAEMPKVDSNSAYQSKHRL